MLLVFGMKLLTMVTYIEAYGHVYQQNFPYFTINQATLTG